MEEVRKRIRLLLIKRVAAAGPDYDEYQINRKVSKTYEPIDASRSRTVASRIVMSSDNRDDDMEESSSSVSIKTTTTTTTTEFIEEEEE